MTNPIDRLNLRQNLIRSHYTRSTTDPSAQKRTEILEVYTFAGNGAGRSCRVKKQNGEVLEATLETNGFIKEGEQVCCYRSGNQLFVKAMNKPPEEPIEPTPQIKEGKIKILYTRSTSTAVELYVGGDREKPKLIHKFPSGTKVSGLCHNHGRGNKYAIGVIAEINDKRQIRTWIEGEKKSGSTTDLNDWKSDRIQPIGNAQFSDPWMPVRVEGKWLFTILNEAKTEKTLCFFGNTEIYKIGSYPPATAIEASVIREKEDGFRVVLKTGNNTIVLDKATIEAKPKLKLSEWIFDPIEYPITGNGSTFSDRNASGMVNVTATARKKKINLKLWDFVSAWKSTIAKLEEDSRKSGSDWIEKKVATGSIAFGSAPLPIELKKQSDRSPGFPNGDPPPDPPAPGGGGNPLLPFEGFYFSFFNGDGQSSWNGSPFNTGYGSRRLHPGDFPHWTQPGVCVGIEYKPGWLIDPPRSTNQWTYFGSDPNRISKEQQNPLSHQYFGYEPHEFQVSEEPLFDVYNGDYRWYRWDGVSAIPAGFSLRQSAPNFYQVNYVLQTDGTIAHVWPFQDGIRSSSTKICNFPAGHLPGSPAPPPSPDGPDPDAPQKPTWQPWSIEEYKWGDPIVLGKTGDRLWKSLHFADWTGKPIKNKPAAKKDDRAIKLKTLAGVEKTIAGKLPLLCAEDNLIGDRLYRVDRSVFYPEAPGGSNPSRSTIKKLPVEIYTLGANSDRVIKKEKIFKIPDDAVILSASFFP